MIYKIYYLFFIICFFFYGFSVLMYSNRPSSYPYSKFPFYHSTRPYIYTSTTYLRTASMSGQRGKRKHASETDDSSPTKKKNPKTSPNKAKKEKTEKTKPATPPAQTSTSSPPKTPKTPGSASKLGLKKETAKSLLKHGSKISPLYNMLYGFARLVLVKKPATEEDFK